MTLDTRTYLFPVDILGRIKSPSATSGRYLLGVVRCRFLVASPYYDATRLASVTAQDAFVGVRSRRHRDWSECKYYVHEDIYHGLNAVCTARSVNTAGAGVPRLKLGTPIFCLCKATEALYPSAGTLKNLAQNSTKTNSVWYCRETFWCHAPISRRGNPTKRDCRPSRFFSRIMNGTIVAVPRFLRS